MYFGGRKVLPTINDIWFITVNWTIISIMYIQHEAKQDSKYTVHMCIKCWVSVTFAFVLKSIHQFKQNHYEEKRTCKRKYGELDVFLNLQREI